MSRIVTMSTGACHDTDSSNDICTPPVAARGFWANAKVLTSDVVTVPKISGVGCRAGKHGKPREILAAAAKRAGVGGNIRWELVMEEAEKFPCGLDSPQAEPPARCVGITEAAAISVATARKPAKRAIMNEDEFSTSAEGSSDGAGSDYETSSEQGTPASKRTTTDFVASSGGAYVYTLATLLGSWSLCRSDAPPPQGCLKAIPVPCSASQEHTLSSPRSKPASRGSAQEQISSGKQEAPKRLRAGLPRSKPKPTSHGGRTGSPKPRDSPTAEKVRSDKLDRLLRLVRDDPPSVSAPGDARQAFVAAPPGLVPAASVATSGSGAGQEAGAPRLPPWRRPKETVVSPPPGL